MFVTPAQLFTLALERHRQPWNWTIQFITLWMFGLTLLFHSYLLLVTSFILLGAGFYQLNLPPAPDNFWFSFVEKSVEWEKNWFGAPWNFIKWYRFLFVVAVAGVVIWALWTAELAMLGLVMGFVYLARVMVENKMGGIDP